METIYLSLVHTGSIGTFFMKSPVGLWHIWDKSFQNLRFWLNFAISSISSKRRSFAIEDFSRFSKSFFQTSSLVSMGGFGCFTASSVLEGAEKDCKLRLKLKTVLKESTLKNLQGLIDWLIEDCQTSSSCKFRKSGASTMKMYLCSAVEAPNSWCPK